MAFNWKTFQTRTLTAIVFAAVMLTGLFLNYWSFLILFFDLVFCNSFWLLVGVPGADGENKRHCFACVYKNGVDGNGLWIDAVFLRAFLSYQQLWVEKKIFHCLFQRQGLLYC